MEPSMATTTLKPGQPLKFPRYQPNDFVVVGHGLSPKGRGWGPLIDNHRHTVIRMWNHHWQDKADYGERYDIGLYEICPVEMKRFWQHNCRQPSMWWIASELRKPYSGPFPQGVITYNITPDDRRWVVAASAMGGHGEGGKLLKLTRGVRAAAYAIEQVASNRRVILVGFDNVRAGVSLSIHDGFPPACVSCPATFPFRNYTGGKVRYSSHDYSVEGPFLTSLAEQRGVELVYAEDYWA